MIATTIISSMSVKPASSDGGALLYIVFTVGRASTQKRRRSAFLGGCKSAQRQADGAYLASTLPAARMVIGFAPVVAVSDVTDEQPQSIAPLVPAVSAAA